MSKNYWLVKSEPSSFSIEDLKKSKNQTTSWDGVRNFQARNFIKAMKTGDNVLFYHSSTEPTAVVGVCEVAKEAYSDPTQFDPEDKHFYPSANPENPTWYMFDLKYVKNLKKPVTLSEIKDNPKLKSMRLVQKGARLSVMPVAKDEYEEIVKMGSK